MSESPAVGALSGVVVVDLGHGIAGPFAARLLGDLGADVIKVEKPGEGDFARRLPPFTTDDDGTRCSALYEFLNWNKRSVALNLADRSDRDRALELLGRADIVIESFAPGRLEAWRLGADALHAINPALVITSISNFGQDGPYAGWLGSDLVMQSMSGITQISGNSDREPLKRGIRQSLYCAGINAAYTSVAGLIAARRTGSGPTVDLAIRDCLASELVLNASFYACMGAIQGRRPPLRDPLGGPLGGGDPLPAKNGYAALQVSAHVTAGRLAQLLGEPRLADPKFATSESRADHAPEVVQVLAELLADQDPREFFQRASDAGLLAGAVQGAADLLECRQLNERGVFSQVPGLGSLRFPAVLAELSHTPTAIRRRAPRVGEHTDEVLAAPSLKRPAASAAAEDLDPLPGPLAGLRVLDLSYVFAAPYMGGLLSDLGAEVIKIEAPKRLDQTRCGFSPYFENDPGDCFWDRGGAFHIVNRGKRSLSLDLSQPVGREILCSLVRDADVLIENYTPRVMRGWGTTYADLARINPRLIMLSNTGFGSTGPWSRFRAQGTTLEATMGLTGYAGYEDGPPSKVGQSYPDFLACWTGMLAILAALVSRESTGAGQWIDLGMYQLGACVIPEALLEYQCTGSEPSRSSSWEPDCVFCAVVPAAGENRWLAVTAFSDEQVQTLGALTGATGDLREQLAAWSAGRDAVASATLLQEHGVAAGPVLDAKLLLSDPQLRHRDFYEWVRCPDGVERPIIGRPYRWSDPATCVHVHGAGPRFGEANEWVLRELLGFTPEQAAELIEARVVTPAPVSPAPEKPIDLGVMLSRGALAQLDPGYREHLQALRGRSPSLA